MKKKTLELVVANSGYFRYFSKVHRLSLSGVSVPASTSLPMVLAAMEERADPSPPPFRSEAPPPSSSESICGGGGAFTVNFTLHHRSPLCTHSLSIVQ